MTTIFLQQTFTVRIFAGVSFLNVGNYYGVDVTGKAVIPFLHQGEKNYRITLPEQVFEIKEEIAESILENLTTPD